MYNVRVGDIIKMKPKYYGPDQEDQWEGVTGIVLEIIEASGIQTGVSALVQHPEEPTPIPIFAFLNDVEKLESEYCSACECDPCDCDWGN